MKRFVTYLYECESGNKSKNVGFIRVNVRNEESTMEVYIRNYLYSSDVGKVYALINKKNLHGIELGKIKIREGQGDGRIAFMTNNILDSGCSLQEIVGVGIRLDNTYIASCWKDEYEGEIIRGEFQIQDDIVENKDSFEEDSTNETSWKETTDLEMPLAVAEETQLKEQEQVTNENYREIIPDESITYEKIDLSQIRDLPSPNWHLTTNSFLVHGFWNYGYLVLKKEMEEDKEKLSLGVPGIFEKPEMVMAMVFGFPTFEEIPTKMVATDMNRRIDFPQNKKNQEVKVGTFGCWFVKLRE